MCNSTKVRNETQCASIHIRRMFLSQIQFHEQPGKFTIDDGLQTPMTLVSDGREIMAAVFYSFIQRNSGI